jgi:hypothetical protein
MKLSRTIATVLSVLFLVLFLSAFGARVWTSGEASRRTGPDHIAVVGERVIVHVKGELLTLSTAGTVQHRQPLAALGLQDSPIDLRALEDGRLLVAGQQPAQVRLCDPVSWQCSAVMLSAPDKVRAQFKALVVGNQQLIMADFQGRALWRQPLAGGTAERIVDREELKGPNDLVLDGRGRLWVADSAGARLVRFDQDISGNWRHDATLDARHEHHRGQCTWPMMISVSNDGSLWVVQPDSIGKNADLIVYHPELGAQSRIALPEPAIARLGSAMLVTDMNHFRIHRVDTVSQLVSSFGDDRFREEMRQGAESRTRYRAYSDVALTGIFVFAALMIVFAFIATPREKRWTAPARVAPPLAPASGPSPMLSQVHWLVRNPATDRLIKYSVYGGFATSLMMLAFPFIFMHSFGFVLPDAATPDAMAGYDKLKKLGALFLVLSVGVPLATWQATKSFKARLGTDGRRLFVRTSDGREYSFDAAQLVYSRRTIACRQHAFAVQMGNGQPLYADQEVDTYLSPLLSQARKLGPIEMLRYQFTHRNRATMVFVVFLMVVAVLIIGTGLWKEMFLPKSWR